jgi:hypothetical protein
LANIQLDQDVAVVVQVGAMTELERRLDGAQLALVALLAVITDEQYKSARDALEAVDGLSDSARAALEALTHARNRG